jgi:DNA-binding NtrC family response regulator
MKHKVLLVHDDDESLLRSLGNSFSAEAFEVVLAEGVQRAIEKSDAGEIDLLLMKLDSRTDEGWQAIDEITEENPFLPVIVITRQPELRNLAEAAGACALVEIPVDVPALLQTIREVLVEPVQRRMERVCHRATDFRQVPPAADSFREQLERGYTTSYRFSTAAPRWGLNE